MHKTTVSLPMFISRKKYQSRIQRIIDYEELLSKWEIAFLNTIYYKPISKDNLKIFFIIENRINKMILINRAKEQNAKISHVNY